MQHLQSVQGGKVCINANGQRGEFFRIFQGLRQGDPLSPFLFNLVADALGNLLNKAKAKGLIKSLMTHLIPEGISHIQYADDTVLMVDPSVESIKNLKIILYCFEYLSGLKINFHKSEVIIFGAQQGEDRLFANMLNCELGSLPMKYLGIPIIDSQKLRMAAFNPIVLKMMNRLDPWKGKYNSSGGNLVLTNTCLSSLPIYMMGFYLFYDGTHKQMDSIRSDFFWQGANKKNKYHMVKWDAITRPRDFGGLGIINTKIMNICLLTKWIWKLHKEKDEIWSRLLRAKYMPNGVFVDAKCRGASQF